MLHNLDIISMFDSRSCQLKSLHHRFGYDVVEEGDEAICTLFGCCVIPVSFMDWACDYPWDLSVYAGDHESKL